MVVREGGASAPLPAACARPTAACHPIAVAPPRRKTRRPPHLAPWPVPKMLSSTSTSDWCIATLSSPFEIVLLWTAGSGACTDGAQSRVRGGITSDCVHARTAHAAVNPHASPPLLRTHSTRASRRRPRRRCRRACVPQEQCCAAATRVHDFATRSTSVAARSRAPHAVPRAPWPPLTCCARTRRRPPPRGTAATRGSCSSRPRSASSAAAD